MALDVSGKTALVTGGGSGICLEFSKLLLENGCNVIVADLGLRPEAEDIYKDYQGGKKTRAVFHKTDVTSWKQLRSAFDRAIKEFGALHIVCPGAGTFEPQWTNFWYLDSGTDTDSSSSFKIIDLNVTHPIRATQLAIDSFERQKLGSGVVVLISSIAAQMALLPAPMYSASKHAISGFIRSMGLLEQMKNIRIVGVAPGIVKTPIWTDDKLLMVDEMVDKWVTTREVAEAMLKMIQDKEMVGGTIVEIGVGKTRKVEELNGKYSHISISGCSKSAICLYSHFRPSGDETGALT